MCIAVDESLPQDLGIAKDPRIKVIFSPERQYALKSRLDAIWKHCPHDAVVVVLDGDDHFSDVEGLSAIAAEYEKGDVDALWTQHKRTDGKPGHCRELRKPLLEDQWVTSHCMTFRKSVLWGVRPEVWKDEKGEYWKAATDQALYLPILQIARRKRFLNRVCYTYQVNETNNPAYQERMEKEIRAEVGLHYGGRARQVHFFIAGRTKESDSRFYQDEFRAPLGVLSMITHLLARGHDVELYDRYTRPGLEPASIEAESIVCIHASSVNRKDAEVLTRRYVDKGHPVYVGGPHALLKPEEIKQWGALEACQVEADFAISRLIETGSLGPQPKRTTELDSIPFPYWHRWLQYETAGWEFGPEKPVFNLNTSRGCPRTCLFCETWRLWGREWYAQSPERVLLDVRQLVHDCGAQAIYFREDNFTADRNRALRIAEKMPVPWACEVRADAVCDPDFAKAMANGGCRAWYLGAESGSERVLRAMNKRISVKQIERACRNANANGIAVAMSLIEGYPGERPADALATQNMVALCRPHVVWRNPYRKPGVYDA